MNPFDSGYYGEEELKKMGDKAIGRNVRIAKSCTVIGLDCIEIGDNVRIDSQGDRPYMGSDDYSGQSMTYPMVPEPYARVIRGPIALGLPVIVESGAVALPDVTFGDGVAVGALSLVKNDLGPWGVFCGCLPNESRTGRNDSWRSRRKGNRRLPNRIPRPPRKGPVSG